MSEENGVLARLNKKEKLEHPARVAELAPAETLARLRLQAGETVCDIGAGSGLFTLAAARHTDAPVYAVETDEQILAQLVENARAQALDQIQPLLVSGYPYAIEADTVALVLLVTVLHEIDDTDALFAEIRRILAPTGRLAVIEFHKACTPLGPPPAHRMGEAQCEALCAQHGLHRTEAFSLGHNFYCHCYTK